MSNELYGYMLDNDLHDVTFNIICHKHGISISNIELAIAEWWNSKKYSDGGSYNRSILK